ncbi:unnamed protein product [Arctia plantaginis]|uniref:Carboxylesterase type B domain-containing protein n=1 Tax=Arctia plantaginis TaxID=874455 RepID=A0A8S1AWR0_ARCPL|nr:unnamed protein product [Arctia plantaginis]
MKWVALVFLIAAGVVRQPSPVVLTSSGYIRGAVSHNGQFIEYFGIPYATVNETNRFQAPLPAPTWNGILNALNENTWCPQSSVGPIVLGEPNCLKLNIYSPIQYTKLLPVMVYIHGGCFFGGTGAPYLYGAAKGLFHKAILQSGSSLAPWALQHDPVKAAMSLVRKLGYSAKDPREIYSILSKKTTKEIITTISNYEDKFCVAETDIFVPCIERHIEGIEPIITDYPANVILSGNYTKVPMIIGYTNHEGIYFVSADYGTSLRNNTKPIDPMKALQRDLQFPSETDKNCTVDKIRRHYFTPSKEEMIMDMVNLYSDLHFKFPLVLESELYSRTTDQPIYYYQFQYSGLINMPKVISGFGLSNGASHGDELFYLFKPHSFPLPHRFLEDKMIKRMVTMWTNFAKYSDPTPYTSRLLPFKWLPSKRFNPTSLVIDTEISTAPMWDEHPVQLWNDTYNKYRRKDYGFKQFQHY